MGRRARKTFGFFCIGVTYQSVKKLVKSQSFIGSGVYSTLGGWFGTGAYKCLQDDVIAERLEQLLSQEEPEMATRMRRLLYERFPSLENRTQATEDCSYSMQELKRQIMRERGYI